MKKILFLTPMSLKPLHVRVEVVLEVLKESGYSANIFNLNNESKILRKINYFTLGFFNVYVFFKAFACIKKYNPNIVYLTDLQYLPIAIIAKMFNKKVIYETLDNNVELHFYNISKKIPLLSKLIFIKKIVIKLEKFLAKNFVDKVIVNSKALVEYFQPLTTNLIYYASPFENQFNINYDKNEIAFLYLGIFNKNKGADLILDFVEKFGIKTFIFGDVIEKDILDRMLSLKNEGTLRFEKRLSSTDLKIELHKIFGNYRILGFSLIKSIHHSYKTQEANKDIDYLAMGIPIIGNYRLPTKDKIEAGCGVFYDYEDRINKLLKDKNFYKKISLNCKRYYNKFYSKKIFKSNLEDVLRKLEVENVNKNSK